MDNFEKVIRGLECIKYHGTQCFDCPYADCADCETQIAMDALELLENGAHWEGFSDNGVFTYRCSKCHAKLTLGMPMSYYCPMCGRKMSNPSIG